MPSKVGVDVFGCIAFAQHERHVRAAHNEDFASETLGVQMAPDFAEISLNFIVVHGLKPTEPPTLAGPGQRGQPT